MNDPCQQAQTLFDAVQSLDLEAEEKVVLLMVTAKAIIFANVIEKDRPAAYWSATATLATATVEYHYDA